jgi:hypothetical protein
MKLARLLVPALMLVASVATAETLNTVPADKPAVLPDTPMRGATMAQVESRFGTPAQRHAAVGQPPITRWDYSQFSVFFEHDKVLHAVIVRTPGH